MENLGLKDELWLRLYQDELRLRLYLTSEQQSLLKLLARKYISRSGIHFSVPSLPFQCCRLKVHGQHFNAFCNIAIGGRGMDI